MTASTGASVGDEVPRVFITGGSGFLGQHLLAALLPMVQQGQVSQTMGMQAYNLLRAEDSGVQGAGCDTRLCSISILGVALDCLVML
jgi:hypothetical protein